MKKQKQATSNKTVVVFFLFVFIGGLLFSSCRVEEKEALSVTVLAIGKADCIVLQTENHTVMIDTGEEENLPEIRSFLQSESIDTLDVLILTHFDKDHVGGAATLIEEYAVKEIYQSAFAGDREEYFAYLAACEKKEIMPQKLTETCAFALDDVRFEIYPPENEHYQRKEDNNSSLVVACFQGENSLLFCGDALEERMAEFLTGCNQSFQFVKLPYHGNYLENYPEILDKLQPQIVAITCSRKNPADEKTLAALQDRGIKVYTTREGNIRFSCSQTIKIDP